VFSENVSRADNQQERVPKDVENLKYYLAGFVDGEGCFSVTICKNKYTSLRWKMDPLFQVYQHKDNSRVLYIFKDVFNCGYVSKKGGNPSCYVYCVDRISDILDRVIPFFDKYHLVGEKYNNFLLFKQIVIGISHKEHLSKEGFIRLARTAFQMNRNGKYRRNSLSLIIKSLGQSSETKSQTHLKVR
jgi:hypothetical protein